MQPLKSVYIKSRRVIRDTIRKNQFLDRVVGESLRSLEHQLAPVLLDPHENGTIETHGLTLHYRPQDKLIVNAITLNGDYEKETRRLIENHLQAGMTYLDLGAHIGYFVLMAAQKVGLHGHVYAVEANPSTYEMLQKNVVANGFEGRCTLLPKAVSDQAGILFFHSSPTSSVNAHVLEADEDPTAAEVVRVEAICLDDYFADGQKIDLVKMDIEGAEVPALHGMRATSANNPQMRMIIEFNYEIIANQQQNPMDFVQALLDCGFTRFKRIGRNDVTPIQLPENLSELIQAGQHGHFNLLCEKA